MRRVARRFGLKEVSEDDDWNVFWTDTSVGLERVMDMKRYQVTCNSSILPQFLLCRKSTTFLA